MLSDPLGELAQAFDVFNEETGLAERGDFIINPHGEVMALEVTNSSVGRNAAEIVRRVEACQYMAEHGEQVCPAHWRPGEKTLTPGLDLAGKL